MYQNLPLEFNAADHFVGGNLRAGRADRVAFYYGDRHLTYGDVFEGMRGAAGLIRACGVEREQRVALLLPDSPEVVHFFWGAIWAGCVPVLLNPAAPAGELLYCVSDSRARLLVTTEATRRAVDPPGVRTLVAEPGSFPAGLPAGAEPVAGPAATHRDEPAFWLYTSGTTGRPKGVIHAHHSMVTCAHYYGQGVVGLTRDDVCYSVAKIPFAYGLGGTLYMPMAVGAAAVLSPAANPFDVVADVAAYRPTVFWGIPYVYAELLAVSGIAPLDASSVRLFVSAAERLPESVWYEFRDWFGKEICEGIGTTEMLHIFLSNRPGDCRPGTCGRPVPGYRVRVVDGEGRDAGPDEAGDLLVSGDSLMLGYWNRHPDTRRALLGDTMRTGDRYAVDRDGNFRFMGRGDDLMKVNGLWVSGAEVEQVLLGHPAVLECAVVPCGADGELAGPEAHVLLRPGPQAAAVTERDLRTFLRARLEPHKLPRRIRFAGTLPRTPTGKIDRRSIGPKAVAHVGPDGDRR